MAAITIEPNLVTIGLIILWVISLSLWFYLLFVRLPASERRIKQETPVLVWESILNRLRDTDDPETQEVFNRTAVYMLKAVASDPDFRNVINGKLKDFASTFSKFILNSMPAGVKAYLGGQGGVQSGGNIDYTAIMQKKLLDIIDNIEF